MWCWKEQTCKFIEENEGTYDRYKYCGRITSSSNSICPKHLHNKSHNLKSSQCQHRDIELGICGRDILPSAKACFYHSEDLKWSNKMSTLFVCLNTLKFLGTILAMCLRKYNVYLGYAVDILTLVVYIYTLYSTSRQFMANIPLCRYQREDGYICMSPTNSFEMTLCQDHSKFVSSTKCMHRSISKGWSPHCQWFKPQCVAVKEDDSKTLCDDHDATIKIEYWLASFLVLSDIFFSCTALMADLDTIYIILFSIFLTFMSTMLGCLMINIILRERYVRGLHVPFFNWEGIFYITK